MNAPENLRYQQSHEWIGTENGAVPVGITDHAQEELSDVVYVELPAIGASFSKGDPVAVVESVKAASDIYAPVTGTVTEVNQVLEDNPGLVNSDPYGDGWIFKLEPGNPGDIGELMDADAYRAQFGQ
jgi:glycine cleavage system H protein